MIAVKEFRKVKQGYFFVCNRLLEKDIIISVVNEVMNTLNFKPYNFEVFDYFDEVSKKFWIVKPFLFYSENTNELFIINYFIRRDKLIFYFLLYSDREKDYQNEVETVLREIVKNFNVDMQCFTLDSVFDKKDILEMFDNINNILEIVKYYKFDKSKIEIDRYFINPDVISVVVNVLNKNYSSFTNEELKYMEILEKNNFLKVFVIFKCSKNGTNIFQLKKLDNFEVLVKNFRCPICGNELDKEIRELSITVSPFLDIYFSSYIWLKNVVFDYFLNKEKIKIYEYEKDAYLVKYMNFFVFFIFCNPANLLSFLSYYRDMEILNLNHAFFFIVNYENKKIDTYLFDKFKDRITFINLTKDKLYFNSFNEELQAVYEKIQFLYNLSQFSNITIEISINDIIAVRDLAKKYEKEKIIEYQLKEVEKIILDEQKKEDKEIGLQGFESSEIKSQEIEVHQEQKSLISKIEIDKSKIEKEEKKEKEEKEEKEDKEDKEKEMEKKEREEIVNVDDFLQSVENLIFSHEKRNDGEEMKIIETVPESVNKEAFQIEVSEEVTGELKSSELESNKIESESLENLESLVETLYVEEVPSKDSISYTKELDELIKEISVEFKPLLEIDLNYQELRNVFQTLLVSMQKTPDKIEAINKNIELFKNLKSSKYSSISSLIDYHVGWYNPRGLNFFPKNETLVLKFKNLIEKLYNSVEHISFDSKEIINLFFMRNESAFCFIYNAYPNLIISLFTLNYGLGNLISNYPAEIRELKLKILERVIDTLENLVTANSINGYVLLNSEFEILNNKMYFENEILYKIYKYNEILNSINAIGWSFGSKNKGFYSAFKVGNIFVVLHQNNLVFNDLVNLYNSFYLLEIV